MKRTLRISDRSALGRFIYSVLPFGKVTGIEFGWGSVVICDDWGEDDGML